MARSLRISFPLPRRSSPSPHTTPGSQYSSQSNIDDSPLSHPGAKAEKVLGASEADHFELKKKQSKKGKKHLRKHPSFMSVTLSDVDAESVKIPENFPFPGMQTPSDLMSQPTQGQANRGTSPLLGEQHRLESTNGGTFHNISTPQVCRADTSSTLRSHYDSKKSPLSISQQTSASSTRDMALRKGFQPFSGPMSLNRAEVVKPTDAEGLHSRNISTDTKVSGSSKLSGNSIKRINSTPRRRPSVMDPPTLYPNANRAFHAVSPPPALINAALPKPLDPQSQQKPSFSRPRWWAKVKPQMPPSIAIEDQQRLQGFDDPISSIKLNVKKPKAKSDAGIRNWFDGLEDEGSTSDSHPDVESKYPIEEPYKSPGNIQEMMLQGAPSQRIPERKRSSSNNSEPSSFSNRKSSFRISSPPVRALHSGSSSQPLEDINTSASTHGSLGPTSIHATTSSKGPRSGADLQLISFLELSSSEDETESNSDAPYRRHRIRASIESYNNEVSVGNAQRAQPVRPRSIVNGPTRPLSRIPPSSVNVPPVPKISDKPRVSQRTSSVRWREVMEDKAGSTESTVDSREASLRGSIGAQGATTRRAKQTIRRSRFMKVTSEEEKLLEAMREKRASIRQDDFDKGFKTAMQLQDIVARPRTAGADGHSNFESRFSASPPPPEYEIKTSCRFSGFSASAEDLRREEAYPFPKLPCTRKGQISPPKPSPKPSPSLSFSPSDILPETPASRNSPMTPPPGQGGMGAYGRSLAPSPPRGIIIAMNNMNHARKRTVSSNVVDIDGIEQQNQVMDENGPGLVSKERLKRQRASCIGMMGWRKPVKGTEIKFMKKNQVPPYLSSKSLFVAAKLLILIAFLLLTVKMVKKPVQQLEASSASLVFEQGIVPDTFRDGLPLPKMLIFDLDYTLWPFWVDTHVSPPLKAKDGGAKSVDRWGESFAFYRDVPGVLHAAKALPTPLLLGTASRTHAPDLANTLLKQLHVQPSNKRAIEYFDHMQIFPGDKKQHFSKIQKASGVPYEEMLFFDDENLNSLETFTPQNLQHIHALLSTPTPLNSFSPLRSLRRIIVSYPTVEAAIAIRQVLDGTPLSENDRVRIYFGEPTPILGEQGEDQYLKAPSLGKLLFISPPPSPPAGWEIREEEPPNKDVHAADLQRALAGLSGQKTERRASVDDVECPMSEDEKEELRGNRKRSGTGSMTVYHPKDHGDNESLPAVMVIDTTAGAEGQEEEGEEEQDQESPGRSSPVDGQGQGGGRILTHTARPPLELMQDS